jgi:hypothetical protein
VPVRFFERYGWAVFAVLSLIVIMFGVGDMISGGETFKLGESVLFRSLTGTTWEAMQAADPGAARMIDGQVRANGNWLLFAGLLSLAISLTGLRRGDRWAWYAMWAWPLLVVLDYVLFLVGRPDLTAGIPVPLISGTVFLVITVATLGLSYRRYLRGLESP